MLITAAFRKHGGFKDAENAAFCAWLTLVGALFVSTLAHLAWSAAIGTFLHQMAFRVTPKNEWHRALIWYSAEWGRVWLAIAASMVALEMFALSAWATRQWVEKRRAK